MPGNTAILGEALLGDGDNGNEEHRLAHLLVGGQDAAPPPSSALSTLYGGSHPRARLAISALSTDTGTGTGSVEWKL